LLLIDDDPVLSRALEKALEDDGHDVTVAGGGQEGIDAFRASLEKGREAFDCVITDLGMPNVDGRQVAAAVRKASAATVVILLTGWGQGVESRNSPPANVACVLAKPPRLRDLRAAFLAHCVKESS
jgi:DNA-binding response OmpR family regulator